MNCQQAKRLLPLWIGRDLADASEAEALRAHLANCAGCSLRERRLQASLDALQSISTTSLETASRGSRPSLWPRLAMILKDGPRRRDHFNGWIPTAAMALAATLMVAVQVVQIGREMVAVQVVQIGREMGTPVQTTWRFDPSDSSARNLFEPDRPDPDQRHSGLFDERHTPGIPVGRLVNNQNPGF